MIRTYPGAISSLTRIAGLAIAVLISGPSALSAQPRRATMVDFAVGSDFEEYLRVLQVAGIAPHYPWSIRGFSVDEVAALAAADSSGPWALKSNFKSSIIEPGAVTLGSTFNSAFPYGYNDGAVWAGKGLTVAASGGVSGRFGPLSFTLAPIAFHAANSDFDILASGKTGPQAYNHATYGNSVDLPQRFGNEAYSRVDPGNSEIRIHTRYATAGISTANQWIGPATEYPFLLGNNAPGFPHVFVGSGNPVNIWIAKLHARVMWGKLFQSDYGPVTGGKYYTGDETGTERLTSSATFVVQPRGLTGLEVGVSRFFHVPYARSEPSGKFWAKPFKVLFLENEYAAGDTIGLDNQLASLFFRWSFPKNGFEVYGERGYEDQFHDRRDFIQNIDHEREYMLGFQKTMRRRSRAIDVVKAEIVNYQVPTLGRIRIENAVYLHSPLRQGHTNRGQLLGTSAGVAAAAASTFSWRRYSASGRTGVSIRRMVRDQIGNYRDQLRTLGETEPLPGEENIPDSKKTDVVVGLGVDRMQFSRYGDFGAKLELMQNYNRNFADDVVNVNLQLMGRIRAF